MAKKVSDSQVAGIKAHAEAKNKETIDKVSKAIDKLKRKNKPINFETVSKEAGVSRATLYNNAQVKERILSLRAISKASPLDDLVAVKKDKIQLKDEKIATLREQVKKLEDDKKKLIIQLVDYEELKSENERLKKPILINSIQDLYVLVFSHEGVSLKLLLLDPHSQITLCSLLPQLVQLHCISLQVQGLLSLNIPLLQPFLLLS